jgi:tetratricopeptide (TPR) repeat protein
VGEAVEQLSAPDATLEFRVSDFHSRACDLVSSLESQESKIQNRKSKIALALLLTSLLGARSALGQQSGNVVLDANEQLFCVLAAVNAAGYDWGLRTDASDKTREQVRAVLAEKGYPVLGELRKFYEEHQAANDPAAELGQYVSLALLLGPPPDFKPTVPEKDLPPDAKVVAGLNPLLKRFYQEANLSELWARIQPRYQAEIARYSDPVRRSVALSDAYLRFPSGAYLGRTYNIYVSLLGAPNQAQARIYGQNYYLVVTPSKELKLSEIRHQYLHFLLDGLALKYGLEVHQKEGLLGLARNAPSLGSDFKEDFSLLVTECLIRAVELRMDKRPKAEAARSLREMTASGLILAPYLYEALEDYERQESSMSAFYKQMILGIDPKEETKRLATVKFAPAPAAATGPATSPAASAEDAQLNQGDNLIYEAKYKEARAVFESVLANHPGSERALYGLAVAASNLRKPDVAEEYFLKTLDAARDVRLVTWSHVYLGRLYDLKGNREQALGQYRAASVTAAAYPDALRAVERGLQKQFGSK